jgi:hypothetical protein
MVAATEVGAAAAAPADPEAMFTAFADEVRAFRAEFPELAVAWAVPIPTPSAAIGFTT